MKTQHPKFMVSCAIKGMLIKLAYLSERERESSFPVIFFFLKRITDKHCNNKLIVVILIDNISTIKRSYALSI